MKKLIFILSLTLTLAACGGGGGSTSNSVSNPPGTTFINHTSLKNYFPNSVGNSWNYMINNTPSLYEIKAITDYPSNNQYSMHVYFSDGSSETFLYQFNAATIDIIKYTYFDVNGNAYKVKTCDPPFPWKIINPSPGQSYSRTYTCTTTVLSTNAVSSSTNTKTISVIGYETVDVANTRFVNALKYSYMYNTDVLPGYVWEVSGIGSVKEIVDSASNSNAPTKLELTGWTTY